MTKTTIQNPNTESTKEKYPPVKLSPKAIKRYNKLFDDIDSGKEPLYEAKNVNDLLDQLYGKKDPVQSKIS